MALVINKLNVPGRYVATQDLVDYVEHAMRERFSDTAGVELRTLQRDFKTIEALFGLVIRFSRRHGGYYIAGQKYVLAEHRRPEFRVGISELLEAIRLRHPVEFDYVMVRHGNAVVHKRINPHFLKESQGRWYLIGYDVPLDNLDAGRETRYPSGHESASSGLRLKTFGLDRMSGLQVLEQEKFRRNEEIDIPALFRECYGIWNNPDDPVEEVVVKYDALDGAFVKSLPLHPSQEIVEETADYVVVRFRIRITNDFVMALLSRSRSLEVLKPLSLRERVYKVYLDAVERNHPVASGSSV